MNATTAHSFSDKAEGTPAALSVSVPASWAEVSDAQLLYVLTLFAAGIQPEHVQLYAFLRFAGLRPVPHSEQGGTRLYRHRSARRPVRLADRDVCAAAAQLEFIHTAPERPQRPDRWCRVRAVDAELHGVPFGEYLQIDNLFQQYIECPEERGVCIDRMAAMLYPDLHPARRGQQHRVLALVLVHWLTGLKIHLSRLFPDLFRPAPGAVADTDMRAAMLAQIRALTAGDVTKEHAVLNVDTWTALSELNEKAREAREIAARSK